MNVNRENKRQMCRSVLGIGSDIVYTPRFSRLLLKFPINSSGFQRLTSKFMHPVETECLNDILLKGQDCTTYLAGIWATKECMLKALSSFVPLQSMPPAISIYTKLCYKTNRLGGGPTVEFDPQFSRATPSHAQFYEDYVMEKKLQVLLSISHDNEYLIAFMILRGRECQ